MSFKDIRGQDQPIQILQEYIRQARLGSSYLFLGPEGVGKYLVAKTLAKALNCENQIVDSCDHCASCLKIEKNEHPDVHWVGEEPSDSLKIEDIRRLKKEISLKPYEGKKKIFILNPAHLLTAEASNALLKILEEPPARSLIILISSKFNLLFKTIISRCRILRFYPLKKSTLAEILRQDYQLEEAAAHFLAYFCEGRIGYGLRLKDTDILKEKNRLIDEFFFKRGPYAQDLSLQNKENLRHCLNILAGWFRDMYFIKIGIPHAQLINLDRKNELLRLMHRYTFLDLDGILSFISCALRYLEENINLKLLFSNLKMELASTI